MIGENLDWEREAMEVMSLGFEGTDNRQEFMVIDIIILFCQRKGLRKVGTGVPFAIQVSLEEDAYLDALMAIAKGKERLGICRMGCKRKRCLRWSKACCWEEVQFQGRFFLVRSMRGRVMVE